MKAYFLKLAEYNSWANHRAAAWLKQIDDEQWQRKVKSSFGSVRETAIHIASAEKIWVDFWTITPEPAYLSAGFSGTKDELLAIWQKASEDINNYVKNYPEDELTRQVTFVYPRGGEGQMEFWQTFSHIINHSTYHRGQLVTLLRSVGFDSFSNTDLATYYINLTKEDRSVAQF